VVGKVYLVGSGPGDPKLISIKGMECIKEADVIVYDRLASPRLLDMAKSGAELIYVGKKAAQHMLEQDQINQLLVDKAKEGKIIARLKGGDPFIFGRGGEEAIILVENNIPFEIISGISSAYSVPAYAGIPVTHRGITSTVAFITGHEDPTKDETDIDWEKISTGVGTLVFLMGVHNLPKIVQQLLKYGRAENTPIALIRWGTLPKQEILVGTLKDIIEKIDKANFKPPAVIIVGDVINLRNKLKWFENKPLFGKHILVTRSRSQASELADLLEKNGAEPIEFPTIKIVPPENFDQLDSAIENLGKYNWLIFTSANGVDFFFERLKFLGKDLRELKGIRIAAIGPATAKKLENLNLLIDYVPKEYKAEAVIEGFKKFGVSGLNILIPRAEVAREILPDQLREMGANVDVVTAYKTVMDHSKVDKVKKMLLQGKIDIVTFTSSSTVKNFTKLLKDLDLKKLLEKVAIACIGPITAETARNLGLKVDIEAKEYTIHGLVEAIIRQIHDT
jgi:uroporphyrinogen III methyltransferase/synthase